MRRACSMSPHDGLRITLARFLHSHGDDRPRAHVYRVFDFVRQMGAAILHLRNPNIRILWVLPIAVEALLRLLLSTIARSLRVGVSIPDAWASPFRYSS